MQKNCQSQIRKLCGDVNQFSKKRPFSVVFHVADSRRNISSAVAWSWIGYSIPKSVKLLPVCRGKVADEHSVVVLRVADC